MTMKYSYFTDTEQDSYSIAVLAPQLLMKDIKEAYLNTFNSDNVICLEVYTDPNRKKTLIKDAREFLTEEVLPFLKEKNVKYVISTVPIYTQALVKQSNTEVLYGYVLDVENQDFKVVHVPNHKAIFYNPQKVRNNIKLGIDALLAHKKNTYQDPGTGIIKFSRYLTDPAKIKVWLDMMIKNNKPLTVDIETFSLKPHTAGIGTISFAWNQHEGITIAVDYTGSSTEPNEPVRELLRNFFENFNQRTIYHNITFDVSILIYQLYMESIIDTKGLFRGINVMLKHWDCSAIITYLATNTCAGNELGLKKQAQEFAGNYAQEEIKDITKIPLDTLMEYNLIDTLSTWYTYNKNFPIMVSDNQLDIYHKIFKPAVVDIIQMQLTGMPIDMERVKEVQAILQKESDSLLERLTASPIVQEYTAIMAQAWADKRNSILKKKRVTADDANITFNPNSPDQLSGLLFDFIGLPVLELTETGKPSTADDVLSSLDSHTSDPEILEVLAAVNGFKGIRTALTNFIAAFLRAVPAPDGWHYLIGNFNLGGTVSGRLSSNDP